MYAEFFGLRELPFNNTPDPRFFYATPDHEEALASLIYAVREKKGFVLLTGEVGAGKTLVARLLIKHFGSTIAFAGINHPIRDPADLMESLCAEFELPYSREDSNSQRIRMLHDFLLARFAQNIPVVLVLDEAQNLSIDAFEQLRMIGNLEADDAKLLQIVIVGQPELQSLFQTPMLRQLRQRLFRSFHLPALDSRNVDHYIRHRLATAGAADPGLFGAECAAAIHRASGGLPRLVNTLCDNVMLSAYSVGRNKLDLPFVESVLATFSAAMPAWDDSPVEATVHEAGSSLRFHPSDTAARTGNRAAQLAALLESTMHRGSNVIRELATATKSASKAQLTLAQREDQIASLVKAVQSTAAQLAPMLTQLTSANRQGAKLIAPARGEALDPVPALRSRPLHRAASQLYVPEEPAARPIPGISRPYRPAVIRQSTVEKAAVISPKFEDATLGQPHPALRLAHRMESLAALVQDAVADCTPTAR